jgi:hypothetical protein
MITVVQTFTDSLVRVVLGILLVKKNDHLFIHFVNVKKYMVKYSSAASQFKRNTIIILQNSLLVKAHSWRSIFQNFAK